jgi:chromosome segregation ATPase
MAKKDDPNINLIAAAMDSGLQLYKAFQYGDDVIKEIRTLIATRDNLAVNVAKKQEQASKEIASIDASVEVRRAELDKVVSDIAKAVQDADEKMKKRSKDFQVEHDANLATYQELIATAQNTLDDLNAGIEARRSELAFVTEQVNEVEKKRAKLFAALAG